jgi:hypothetical protein
MGISSLDYAARSPDIDPTNPRPRDFMIEGARQSTQPELSESTESLFPTEQELDTFAHRITLRMSS